MEIAQSAETATVAAMEAATATTTVDTETATAANAVRLEAAVAHRKNTRHPPLGATLAATRVGGEAEAAMMTAVTHVVTEEMVTTTEADADTLVLVLAHPTALTARRVTTVTTATVGIALIATRGTIAGQGTTIVMRIPSVRQHHNLLKMNGTAALSLSSSSPPVFALAT